MTTDELSKLTAEQKRIKIAEACGFSFKDEGWRYPNEPDWQMYKAVYRGGAFVGLCKPEWTKTPDYLNDLNAMHEAEMTRDGQAWVEYRSCLVTIVTAQARPVDPWYKQDFVHATAAQRADAFLLTVG